MSKKCISQVVCQPISILLGVFRLKKVRRKDMSLDLTSFLVHFCHFHWITQRLNTNDQTQNPFFIVCQSYFHKNKWNFWHLYAYFDYNHLRRYKQAILKSVNLQYNTLVYWAVGTNNLLTNKRLMFQTLFFFH